MFKINAENVAFVKKGAIPVGNWGDSHGLMF